MYECVGSEGRGLARVAVLLELVCFFDAAEWMMTLLSLPLPLPLLLPPLLARVMRARVVGRSGERPRAVPGRCFAGPMREAGRMGPRRPEVAVAGRA